MFFCIELVPNLGREFVLWRTDTPPPILGWGGTALGTAEGLPVEGGGESSARRARICCSGILLRLPPYLELMLLLTLLEILPLAESESESCTFFRSDVGVLSRCSLSSLTDKEPLEL